MPSLAQQRRLDTVIGAPVCALLNALARLLGALLRRDHSLGAPPRRILVIKLIGIGSIVHATPLLTALKVRYPEATLGFLCFPEAQPIVECLPQVDEITVLDDRTYLRLLGSVLWWVFGVWRRRVDLVVDLEVYSKFSTILSTLTCARDRAGYFLVTTLFRRGLYTHLVYYNRLRHVQEAYRQLGLAVGAEPSVGRPLPPTVSDAERQAAKRLLSEWQQEDRKLLLVNVNAGDLCLERRWPADAFARVIAELAGLDNVLVVMTGSPSEAAYTRSVHELLPEAVRRRVVVAAGQTSFGEFLALTASADAILTNDSGPLHLAAAFGTPSVSLWGPGLPDTYRPLDGDHRVLWAAPYCSPCLYWADEPPCAGDNRCMARIPWQSVVTELAQLLGLSVGPLPPVDTGTPAAGAADGLVVRGSSRAAAVRPQPPDLPTEAARPA